MSPLGISLLMLVALAGFDIPLWFIRRQISSALQIVVQTRRLSGEDGRSSVWLVRGASDGPAEVWRT